LSRGLHLDGLADTVDALGSYRGRERALEIMKSAEVGPMGVAAIVLVLVIETAALTSLMDHHGWAAIAGAVAVGRFAITLGCRRGVPAARPDGLGSFVAGTVAPGICVGWGVGLLGAMTVASDDHWPGVAAVLIAVAATLVVLAHVRARLGGITGDVLGAVCELSTAIALLTVSAR
jgi:adenosylcobinamide-GDP ribazoletransferase